jgi:hypothetical protein
VLSACENEIPLTLVHLRGPQLSASRQLSYVDWLVSRADWPISIFCSNTTSLSVFAVFDKSGLLTIESLSKHMTTLIHLTSNFVLGSLEDSDSADWIGVFVSGSIPNHGDSCEVELDWQRGLKLDVTVGALEHTELLTFDSSYCDSSVSPAPVIDAAYSQAAWRTETALLEVGTSRGAPTRSDAVMASLLEMQPTRSPVPTVNHRPGAAAGTNQVHVGPRAQRLQQRQGALLRRVLADTLPGTDASLLIETDGSTLRQGLKAHPAYSALLLEDATSGLVGGIPGLDIILKPVMFSVMKPGKVGTDAKASDQYERNAATQPKYAHRLVHVSACHHHHSHQQFCKSLGCEPDGKHAGRAPAQVRVVGPCLRAFTLCSAYSRALASPVYLQSYGAGAY